MTKFLSFVVAFVVTFLSMAVSAEAQYRSQYDPRVRQTMAAISGEDCRYTTRCNGGYNGGYEMYDPALVPYIQQMMRLPAGLVACEIDFATGKARSCRFLVKEPSALQTYLQNMDNSVPGTIRTRNNKPCFKPFDDTDFQIGTVSGGALGAGGGAVVGSVWGRKGAAIGAVLGAISGGLFGSRNSRGNCLEFSGTIQSATNGPVSPAVEESVPSAPAKSVSGPAVEASVQKIIRNRFEEATIRVYEGSSLIAELKAGETDSKVKVSSPDQVWGEAWLKNPANGKLEWTPLQLGKGIDELPMEAGWVFGNPNTHPNINGGR